MARTKHGKSWIQRHLSDPFVQKAQQQGYRSRASFKLLALQKKYALFRSGMVVVDLGAAPGGWSQVAAQWVGKKTRIIAVDKLPMEPIEGVFFVQGDFCNHATLEAIHSFLEKTGVDWVLSDMSPNLSGILAVDQPRIMTLAEEAWDFAKQNLKTGGGLLVKVFQGEGFDLYFRALRRHFQKVTLCKPEASRAASREHYVLARGYYNIIE